MRLTIQHQTSYRYSAPVTHSIQYLRLIPRRDNRQRVLAWHLGVPAPTQECVDPYGNIARVLVVDRPHETIHITVNGVVETRDDVVGPSEDDGPLSPLVFLRETPLTVIDQPLREFARSYAARMVSDAPSGLHELMDGIRQVVRYTKGSTNVQSTAAAVFAQGEGVCQDHSHIFIACCRALGVPARYVSGYLYSELDFSLQAATHAWAEAWVDPFGWYSFDVANAQAAGAAHLRLAVGRDYLDACPVRGMRYGGGTEEMDVQVQVTTSQ